MRSFLYFFLLMIYANVCVGQVRVNDMDAGSNRYNLSINNGLPANHIYFMIKDSYGYLWLGTTNGVVRYNGYECKIFNLSNGLPTADVWSLFEDKRGRIWLGDISGEIGYIYRNEYYTGNAAKNIKTFYPVSTRDYEDGVIFINWSKMGLSPDLCITNNDTIQIAGHTFGKDALICIDIYGKAFFLTKDSLYKAIITGNKVGMESLCNIDSTIRWEAAFGPGNTNIINNYLIHYVAGSDTFSVTNVHNGKNKILKTIDYAGHPEPVYLMTMKEMRNERNNVVFITEHHILQFKDDTDFKFNYSLYINSLANDSSIKGSNVTSFIDDALWGNCMATNSNGLYINYNKSNNIFHKTNLDLYGYRHAGRISETVSFWWNRSLSSLARVENNEHVTIKKYPVAGDVNTIIPYNKDSCLLFFSGSNNTYWYMQHDHKLVNTASILGGDITSVIIGGTHSIYMASKFAFQKKNWQGNNTITHSFDNDRYKGLVYDSIRHDFWAWNNGKIFIHFHNDKDSIISKDDLVRLGVKQVEKIVIDNAYGNMFFKSNDRLVLYDVDKGSYTPLFENYNFTGATVNIYDHTLIVAGAFGILFSKITGTQSISAPVVYNNIKNNFYGSVSDMQLAMHEVLLNTDKGTYRIPIPSDSTMIHARQGNIDHECKFIVNYMDTTIDVVSGDTLKINPKNPVLAFDFINPMGNGKLRYSCHFSTGDTQWHELNESVLNLPRLEGGNTSRSLL